MVWIYLLLALAAGTALPVQAGVNASLAKWTGHSALAALISFAVGSVLLLAYALALRPALPAASHLAQAPWWAWVGGALGAFFIVSSIILVPKLGAALYVALVIAGQTMCALVLDHFGLLGYEVRPVNFWRAVGALLLLCGVALIRRF
jgi:transporter family-2 protein